MRKPMDSTEVCIWTPFAQRGADCRRVIDPFHAPPADLDPGRWPRVRVCARPRGGLQSPSRVVREPHDAFLRHLVPKSARRALTRNPKGEAPHRRRAWLRRSRKTGPDQPRGTSRRPFPAVSTSCSSPAVPIVDGLHRIRCPASSLHIQGRQVQELSPRILYWIPSYRRGRTPVPHGSRHPPAKDLIKLIFKYSLKVR